MILTLLVNFWLRASCFRVRYKRAPNKFSSYFLQYFQFPAFLKWNFYNEQLPPYCIFFWINWTQIYTWAIHHARLANMKHGFIRPEINTFVYELNPNWSVCLIDSWLREWNQLKTFARRIFSAPRPLPPPLLDISYFLFYSRVKYYLHIQFRNLGLFLAG